MYISPERTRWSHRKIEKSFSPAVYIFHAIFQNPSLFPLDADVHSLIHSWTNREDSRILKTPQDGDPRSSAPATRIQIRKLSLSLCLMDFVIPFPSTRKKETKSEEYGQRKEKRSDVCASIYDVRWIGARASTLVIILMRLLYDVTFNGAPKPLPSGYNSLDGPSDFFSLQPSTNEKNWNDREIRFHTSANANFIGGGDPFDEDILTVSRNCWKAQGEQLDLNTDLLQLR